MNNDQRCRVWSVQLELLELLLEKCKKYNLSIWADSGTLLGAIRHSGYIPWDDDIDMVMLRDDYDKLVKISSSEFSNPYFFQTAYSDKNYIRGHAQLRKSTTTAILPNDINKNFNQGIFIDIFVLDSLPSAEKDITKYLNNVNFWRFVLQFKVGLIKFSFHPKHMIKCIVALFLTMFFSKEKLFYFFELALKKFNKYDYQNVSYTGLSSSLDFVKRNILNKTWFENTIYYNFEDLSIPIPEKYDDILKRLYGKDYMTPVKMQSLHGEVIFSTEQSYQNVLISLRNNLHR